jgi:hypothetical protein
VGINAHHLELAIQTKYKGKDFEEPSALKRSRRPRYLKTGLKKMACNKSRLVKLGRVMLH